MNTRKLILTFLYTVLGIVWTVGIIGFAAPTTISSASTEVVIFGIVLVLSWILSVILTINHFIKRNKK